MLHVWLIPVLLFIALVLVAFYLLLRFTGGTGVRTEGRTLVHKPRDEESPPPD
jgi:hypothetical protein